jgi:HEAT repeat protein
MTLSHAALELALRGADPELVPQLAAEALAKTWRGMRLLVSVIQSSGPHELRQAAVYGLVWGNLKAPQLHLLLRVFENTREHPDVRGQAAEALGPRLHGKTRRQRERRSHLRAVRALIRGLDDPAPEVRFWSIYALAHPENAWLLPKLEVMANDPAACAWGTIRQEALWAKNWILKRDQGCDPATL